MPSCILFHPLAALFQDLSPFPALTIWKLGGQSAHLTWLTQPRDLKHSFGLLPYGLIFTLFNFLRLPQILLEIDGQKPTQTNSSPSLSFSLAHILLSFPGTWRPAEVEAPPQLGQEGVVLP